MNLLKQAYKSFMRGPVYIIMFGLVFFGIGSGLTYRQIKFKSQGIQIQGEVISLSPNCDSDGCSYTPIVHFKTRNGKAITFASAFSSSPPAYDEGETVTVIYSLDDPKEAIIKGEGQVFRLVFMSVGGIIIAIGVYIWGSDLGNNFLKEENRQ
jgi:hypothetical protein